MRAVLQPGFRLVTVAALGILNVNCVGRTAEVDEVASELSAPAHGVTDHGLIAPETLGYQRAALTRGPRGTINATLNTWNGTQWQFQYLSGTPSSGWTMSPIGDGFGIADHALDDDGRPHVVITEQTPTSGSAAPPKLVYAKRQSGSWRLETIVASGTEASRIVVGPSGSPRVVFVQNGQVFLATRGATGWRISAPDVPKADIEGGEIFTFRMAIAQSDCGDLHVAYVIRDFDDIDHLYYAVKKGHTWTWEEIGAPGFIQTGEVSIHLRPGNSGDVLIVPARTFPTEEVYPVIRRGNGTVEALPVIGTTNEHWGVEVDAFFDAKGRVQAVLGGAFFGVFHGVYENGAWTMTKLMENEVGAGRLAPKLTATIHRNTVHVLATSVNLQTSVGDYARYLTYTP
jgi:hypothetical protein